MNVFDRLDEVVQDAIASRKAFTGFFNKKQLKEYLAHRQTELLMVVKVLDSAVAEIGPGIAKAVAANTKDYPAYIEYRKSLSRNQVGQETQKFLSTLVTACKRYAEILGEIEQDVDKLFKLDRIGLLNMRTSHLVVAGILHQSMTLCKYTKFTLSYVSSNFLGMDDIPKYRVKFLNENASYVASITNAVNDGTGATDYKALINKIQKSAADQTLIDQDAKSQVESIKGALKLGRSSEGVITAGILGIPSFRSIGEAVNLIKKEIAKYLLQEESWMRSHVAILNAKLEGMNNNDDEYVKLEKIIHRYESMIDMLERARSTVE